MKIKLAAFGFTSFTVVALLLASLFLFVIPALAQQSNAQPSGSSRQQPIVPSPFQGLANVLRNPEAPPPPQPANPTGQPPLPSAIPQGALVNGAR